MQINRIKPQKYSRKYDPSWRKPYRLQRWRDLRKAYLADHPLCEMCLADHKTCAAQELHHKQLTRLGGAMFDRDNLMALCRACHIELHILFDLDNQKYWQSF